MRNETKEAKVAERELKNNARRMRTTNEAKVSKQIRVDETIHRKLKMLSADRGVTMTRLLSQFLELEIDKQIAS